MVPPEIAIKNIETDEIYYVDEDVSYPQMPSYSDTSAMKLTFLNKFLYNRVNPLFQASEMQPPLCFPGPN